MNWFEFLFPFLAVFGLVLPLYLLWADAEERAMHFDNLYCRERDERKALLKHCQEVSEYWKQKIKRMGGNDED